MQVYILKTTWSMLYDEENCKEEQVSVIQRYPLYNIHIKMFLEILNLS